MATPLAKRLASDPVSKIELSIRCSSLLNKDIASYSDPCCLVYLMTGSVWTEIGRTENIKNSLNPVFAKLFQLDYYFEEVQKIRFLVYDIDNSTPTLNDDDFLGSMECTIGDIVSNSPCTKPLLLKGNKVAGKSTITIRAQEIAKANEILCLQFSAKNLDNKDFLGKSDPYLEFHRRLKDGGYQLVHRTEVVRNNLNPRWRPFEIRTSRLCGGNATDPIKIECYDHDDDGGHDFIGSFETTLEHMRLASSKVVEWPCINPKKKAKKKNYTNSGVVVLSSCVATKEFSFLDFVFGGLQINFTVGIDFTASNGNPQDPRSLHFMSHQQPNHYMRAIQSVGQVIQDYDSDQMFPALGYGAKVPPTREVSHCFALNFNPGNPFCTGIQGILDAYRMCLGSIQLYGPTNFSPIIYHAAQFAEAAHRERKPKNYYVLLIITDGVISDMQDTVRAIVYASTLPFSIIIVGVGDAEFDAMDILDGDNGVLRDVSGNCAKRDIVQFVPFRNFLNASHAALAKQVLAEVPDQVVSYYRLNNIQPEKPRPMDAVIQQVSEMHKASTPNSAPSIYPTVSSHQLPPTQPGHVPPSHQGQSGSYPGQYPATQQGQYNSSQQGQHVTSQPGHNPTPQAGQHPPMQPGQYPPMQKGQHPTTQAGQHPPAQAGQYPPMQPGQHPPAQAGQYPPMQPGQYPPTQSQYGFGAYPQPGGYPGYPQPGGYPGYPQPAAGGYPGYPQSSPAGYPQPPSSGYPGYSQPSPGGYTGYPQHGYPPPSNQLPIQSKSPAK